MNTHQGDKMIDLKKELKFQIDQARGMFDGFGQFTAELLVLGSVGITMVVIILAGIGILAEAAQWLF
jgi:hypothetical protein